MKDGGQEECHALERILVLDGLLPVYASKKGRHAVGYHESNTGYYSNQLILWVMRMGRGRVEIGSEAHDIVPGLCFFLLHSELLRLRVTIPSRELVICFRCLDRNQHDLLPDRCGLPRTFRVLPEWSFFEAIVDRIAHHLSRATHSATYGPQPDYNAPPVRAAAEWLRVSLSEILAVDRMHSPGRSVGHARRLTELCAKIRQNPARWSSVAELAQEACLSYRHFSRLFHRQIGMPPKDYILRQRLHQACRMLVESDDPAGRIAERLGYADPSSFWHDFKRFTGQTPNQYRDSVSTDPKAATAVQLPGGRTVSTPTTAGTIGGGSAGRPPRGQA